MFKKLRFGECDHEGDLEAFEWEVVNSGGHVTEKRWNCHQRTGIIEIIVANEQEYERFLDRFKARDSYHFLLNKRS